MYSFQTQEELLNEAKTIVAAGFNFNFGQRLTDSETVRDFFLLNHKQTEHESFGVAFLNSKGKLISYDVMFNGTINSVHISKRTILKACLDKNSSAVLLCHHHPSGDAEPSDMDKKITSDLQNALSIIDVKVFDHLILAGTNSFSFSENNLL